MRMNVPFEESPLLGEVILPTCALANVGAGSHQTFLLIPTRAESSAAAAHSILFIHFYWYICYKCLHPALSQSIVLSFLLYDFMILLRHREKLQVAPGLCGHILGSIMNYRLRPHTKILQESPVINYQHHYCQSTSNLHAQWRKRMQFLFNLLWNQSKYTRDIRYM